MLSLALTPKQIEFIANAHHRWNIKIGATRSGKTFLDYSTVVPKRILNTTGSGLVVLLGYTQQTLERNIFEPMRSLWGPTLVGDIVQGRNTIRLFGRTCHALGADKISSVSRLRGASIEYGYGDEVPTWNEEVFQLLKSRLDKPNSAFDGTGNPESPNHWFKKFLESDADIYSQHYTIDDNPMLDPVFISNLKREYAGSVYYDRYILGNWAVAEGAIYPQFDPARHVVSVLPHMRMHWVGVDYGHSNPTVFILAGLGDDGRLYVVAEDYHAADQEGDRSPAWYSQAMIRFLRRHETGLVLDKILVDPSAKGFITQLREDGVARVAGADNDVLARIQLISSMFSRDLVRIHSSCVRLIDELRGYVWEAKAQEHGEDRPVKKDDHGPDALGYLIMAEKNEWKRRVANG